MSWTKITNKIWSWYESCIVYLVEGPEGGVLINCGSGQDAQRMVEEAKVKISDILFTHHFREAASGANLFKELCRATLWAPASEAFYLADAEQHWRERQTMMLFDTRWDRKGPRESILIDKWLEDYADYQITGLQWFVLPTRCVSFGAVSLLAEIGGKKVAFTGELIHSKGKVFRLAPLQYNYNDALGARNVYVSS